MKIRMEVDEININKYNPWEAKSMTIYRYEND